MKLTTVIVLSSLSSACLAQQTNYPLVPGERLKYADNFNDADAFDWDIFEEIVAGDPCYKDGTGKVERFEDIFRRKRGGSLLISANDGQELGSNHVLGVKNLSDRGIRGRYSYRVFFYVDPDILKATQTGPELSIQNTFAIGFDQAGSPQWRTNIGALQYVGVTQKWNIWTKPDASVDTANGQSEDAVWMPIEGLPVLNAAGWWKLKYIMKFDSIKRKSKYIRAEFTSPVANNVTKVNLRNVRIAQEDRGWNEGSLFATLEAQNLYQDCNNIETPTVHKAYYDDMVISSSTIVPEYPEDSTTTTTVAPSTTTTLAAGESTSLIFVTQAPPTGELVVDGGNLVYTASDQTTSFGIKYTICIPYYNLCSTENWWEVHVSVPQLDNPGTIQVTASETDCGSILSIANPVDAEFIDWDQAAILDNPLNIGVTVGSTNEDFLYPVPGSGSGVHGFKVRVCNAYTVCTEFWIEASYNCNPV